MLVDDMSTQVEEIKNRIDIADFIGTYTQLKRAGSNFSARCPFHSEKTPSFMVSRAKQLWYCFGACQEGGDVFKFLMKIEGLEFPEALKILADKAGIELPKYDKRIESRRNTLLEILKSVTAFYQHELASERGVIAREYLIKRGLTDAVINEFGLGYAPDSWDALTGALHDKFKPEDIVGAGIAIRSERNQGIYDRFRHRIMFPIRDIHGNTIGFTSRLLDEKRAEGKYVNTPETMVYNKSRALYGLDLAREKIRKSDYVVLVEGNMDVITCHQFGMSNVVAASGTALTFDQIRLIKRYAGNVMICFDADPAGENAAKRGIDIALAEGMRVKVVSIPKECGKDPDECIRRSIKTWEAAVRGAKEIMEYYLEKASVRFDIKTANGRAQFVNTLLREVTKLPDLVEQDFWLKRIGEIAHVEEMTLREQMRRSNKEQRTKNKEQDSVPYALGPTPLAKSRPELLSERLLAIMLTDPNSGRKIIDSVLPEMLVPSALQELYTKLVLCYTAYNSTSPTFDGANFRQFWRNWSAQADSEADLKMLSTADPGGEATLNYRASILELYGDKEFEGWDPTQFSNEGAFLMHEIRHEYIKLRRGKLAEAMRQAERAGDTAHVKKLAREFEALAVQE